MWNSFYHVALLLCCLGLLSRCIYCCAPPLCYVASLFCFFFSFFGLYQLIASSFLFPQFFTCFFIQFLLDSSLSLCFLPPLKVCFWGFCAFILYMFFFRLFGAWLTLLGFFSRFFSFVFRFLLLYACVHVLCFLAVLLRWLSQSKPHYCVVVQCGN